MRSQDGCPWDKEQTFSSLRKFMIEEAYETVEAVNQYLENTNFNNIKEELGDVLLQVVLNSAIAEEEHLFNLEHVIESINTKMIRRHPHIFGEHNLNIQNSEDVLQIWKNIKLQEKQKKNEGSYLLDDISKYKYLPTLNYGIKISEKAYDLGFTWNIIYDIFKNFESEVQELSNEIFTKEPDINKIKDEAGDVIYAFCNLITYIKQNFSNAKDLDLDLIARAAYDKFLIRFKAMEDIYAEKKEKLNSEIAKNLSLEEWDLLWQQAKLKIKAQK